MVLEKKCQYLTNERVPTDIRKFDVNKVHITELFESFSTFDSDTNLHVQGMLNRCAKQIFHKLMYESRVSVFLIRDEESEES